MSRMSRAAVGAACGGARRCRLRRGSRGRRRARPTFSPEPNSYDAVVLDLGLPRIDGLTLLRRWREAGLAVPVLVLTARGSWHEKVQGIDSGADDYVAKPFRMEEVLARLRALIRRASGQVTPQLRCGAVALDPRLAKVTLDGAPGEADQPRVPRALVPDAPPRPRRVAGGADRAHLRAGLRSRLEHRGGVHRPAAPEARRRVSSRPSAAWATGSEVAT